MRDNQFKFFTQAIEMMSPTYYEALGIDPLNEKGDWLLVPMTADIIFHDSLGGDKLSMTIINKMFDDPVLCKENEGESLSIHLDMDRQEVVYLKKYLEAFLENHPIK